jgi:vancomycin resistance protein VanJ
MENEQMLGLGLGWKRALTVDLDTPDGTVSVYVIHAASTRPGAHQQRDTMLTRLGNYLARDHAKRVIAVGDFNAGSSDRALQPITDVLSEPNQSDGGFGFTWPQNTPIIRLDHLFQRGMTTTANTTLTAGASDHLAIITTLEL